MRAMRPFDLAGNFVAVEIVGLDLDRRVARDRARECRECSGNPLRLLPGRGRR